MSLSVPITPELCIEECEAKDFTVAGVQSASQCFCGDLQEPAQEVLASECNRACPGDENQMCGGSWRMNLYSTGLFVYHLAATGCQALLLYGVVLD